MATCTVNGTIQDASGAAVTSATVYARLVAPTVLGTTLVTPFEISAATDTLGAFALTVQQSLTVIFTVQYPVAGTEPMRTFNYTGTIPAATSAQFTSVITIE